MNYKYKPEGDTKVKRVSVYISTIVCLVTLFVMCLWLIDVSASSMIGQEFMLGAGLQAKAVLNNLFFTNADPNIAYHVGLVGAVGVFTILLTMTTTVYLRYVFGKDSV